MIDTSLLCNQHLKGEHYEIHLHKHNFEKKHSIAKRVSPIVQIEPLMMEIRHNQLVEEMTIRNMKHNSSYSLPDLSYLPDWQLEVKVDISYNLQDLCNRCEDCNIRIMGE